MESVGGGVTNRRYSSTELSTLLVQIRKWFQCLNEAEAQITKITQNWASTRQIIGNEAAVSLKNELSSLLSQVPKTKRLITSISTKLKLYDESNDQINETPKHIHTRLKTPHSDIRSTESLRFSTSLPTNKPVYGVESLPTSLPSSSTINILKRPIKIIRKKPTSDNEPPCIWPTISKITGNINLTENIEELRPPEASKSNENEIISSTKPKKKELQLKLTRLSAEELQKFNIDSTQFQNTKKSSRPSPRSEKNVTKKANEDSCKPSLRKRAKMTMNNLNHDNDEDEEDQIETINLSGSEELSSKSDSEVELSDDDFCPNESESNDVEKPSKEKIDKVEPSVIGNENQHKNEGNQTTEDADIETIDLTCNENLSSLTLDDDDDNNNDSSEQTSKEVNKVSSAKTNKEAKSNLEKTPKQKQISKQVNLINNVLLLNKNKPVFQLNSKSKSNVVEYICNTNLQSKNSEQTPKEVNKFLLFNKNKTILLQKFSKVSSTKSPTNCDKFATGNPAALPLNSIKNPVFPLTNSINNPVVAPLNPTQNQPTFMLTPFGLIQIQPSAIKPSETQNPTVVTNLGNINPGLSSTTPTPTTFPIFNIAPVSDEELEKARALQKKADKDLITSILDRDHRSVIGKGKSTHHYFSKIDKYAFSCPFVGCKRVCSPRSKMVKHIFRVHPELPSELRKTNPQPVTITVPAALTKTTLTSIQQDDIEDNISMDVDPPSPKESPYGDGTISITKEKLIDLLTRSLPRLINTATGKAEKFYCPYPNCETIRKTDSLMVKHALHAHQFKTEIIKELKKKEPKIEYFTPVPKPKYVKPPKKLYTVTIDFDMETGDSDFPCPEEDCEFVGETRIEIVSHLKGEAHRGLVDDKSGRPPYLCPYCDHKAKTRHIYKKHYQTHVNGYCHKCPDCPKYFKMLSTLSQHKRRVHMGLNMIFSCKFCTSKFSNNARMIAHSFAEHVDTMPQDLKTKYEESLIRKKTNKKKTSPHKCPICKEQFPWNLLKSHMINIHTNVKSFQCDFDESCKKSFYLQRDLSLHIRQVHKRKVVNDLRQLKCDFDDQCDKVFDSETDLKNHKLFHEGVSEFPCDFDGCDQSFLTPEELKDHTKNGHQKTKCKSKSVCYICGAVITQLSQHIRQVHERQRPPFERKCDICNKVFKSLQEWNHHNRVHENPNYKKRNTKRTAETSNISCNECGQYFASKYNLAGHIKRVHSSPKNVRSVNKCNFCSKQFSSETSLTFHLKSHENINQVPKQQQIDSFGYIQYPQHFRTHAQNLQYSNQQFFQMNNNN